MREINKETASLGEGPVVHRRRRNTCLGCASGGGAMDGGGILLCGLSGLKTELLACFRAYLGRQPCTRRRVRAGEQRGRDSDGNKFLTVGRRGVVSQCSQRAAVG